MSRNSISQATKKEVANRAGNKCEYCLQSERVSYFRFHIRDTRHNAAGPSVPSGKNAQRHGT